MMLRRAVLPLLLFLGACGSGTSVPKNSVDSNGGRYRVTFRTTPEPIPLNSPFTLTFQVAAIGPATGSAARSVDVDARMPDHGHGMNRAAKVTRLPDGAYQAEGLLFHMPGHWELYIDISEGGRSERAQVDVELK